MLTGGRGKAGGVRLAAGPDEAAEVADAILGLDIRGHVVRRLWVERASAIAKEYYLSVTFDRGAKKPLLMLTREGGVEIEEVAARDPGALARVHVDPLVGYQAYQGRRLVHDAGIDDAGERRQLAALVERLYGCFAAEEAMLCEINPLVVTPDGELLALDAKVTVDDSALFRHPDVAAMRDSSAADPLEALAREKGVTYVRLDGSVGILANGAGLAMATVDLVGVAGGRPANFCDLGGGGRAEGVVAALEVIAVRPEPARDLLQRVRRAHAVRRGRARHPHRARPDRDRGADRRAARRHERAGGPRAARGLGARPAPRRGRRCSRRRGARWSWPDETCPFEPCPAAAVATEVQRPVHSRSGPGAGVSDAWSERAELYRTSAAHSEGADLDLIVEWAAGARTALDVATGGGHVARRLREAGLEVVTCDPAPGMRADVIASPRTCRSPTRASTSTVTRVAAHHFADVRAAVRELARVAADRVLDRRQPRTSATRSRRPRRSATRRTSATTARTSGASSLDDAGLAVDEVRVLEHPVELEPWLERTDCTGDDAARVRGLLADRLRDGWILFERIALRASKPRDREP